MLISGPLGWGRILLVFFRENRKKHDMHINPNNLDVIIQCTHCWWNPINAKVLRPFIKKKGYEHVLKDTEGQGLQAFLLLQEQFCYVFWWNEYSTRFLHVKQSMFLS